MESKFKVGDKIIVTAKVSSSYNNGDIGFIYKLGEHNEGCWVKFPDNIATYIESGCYYVYDTEMRLVTPLEELL